MSLAMSIAVFCCIWAPNSCKHKNLVSTCTVCCAQCAICISINFFWGFFWIIFRILSAGLTVLIANYFGTTCDHLFERLCCNTFYGYTALNEFGKNIKKKKNWESNCATAIATRKITTKKRWALNWLNWIAYWCRAIPSYNYSSIVLYHLANNRFSN